MLCRRLNTGFRLSVGGVWSPARVMPSLDWRLTVDLWVAGLREKFVKRERPVCYAEPRRAKF